MIHVPGSPMVKRENKRDTVAQDRQDGKWALTTLAAIAATPGFVALSSRG